MNPTLYNGLNTPIGLIEIEVDIFEKLKFEPPPSDLLFVVFDTRGVARTRPPKISVNTTDGLHLDIPVVTLSQIICFELGSPHPIVSDQTMMKS